MFKLKYILLLFMFLFSLASPAWARIKLVALPERGATLINLANPQATLIEEERVLTLQKGLNKVDFSWKGVGIDEDSIRLNVLTHPDKVSLLGVSYPPNESALVWEIFSEDAYEVAVRISYLLSGIDRLIAYTGQVDKAETQIYLKNLLVLRNFSGEDFKDAEILLDFGKTFSQAISHEETKQLQLMSLPGIPIKKVWTFDARKLPWDPEKLDTNVGIPVSYWLKNDEKSGLGKFSLPEGKVRVFQDDGKKGTIFLGEDTGSQVPVGEDMKACIGDSRDIVVTQRKMEETWVNVRKNKKNDVVLHDTDEEIRATIENFKEGSAVLTLIEEIQGQWDMEKCNMEYRRTDAYTLEFQVELPAHSKKELTMRYHRRNIR